MVAGFHKLIKYKSCIKFSALFLCEAYAQSYIFMYVCIFVSNVALHAFLIHQYLNLCMYQKLKNKNKAFSFSCSVKNRNVNEIRFRFHFRSQKPVLMNFVDFILWKFYGGATKLVHGYDGQDFTVNKFAAFVAQ